VDARRSALGLQPLSQRMAKAERVAATDVTEHSRKQQKYEAWLRRVGWRS
jgi:hypothetical protein